MGFKSGRRRETDTQVHMRRISPISYNFVVYYTRVCAARTHIIYTSSHTLTRKRCEFNGVLGTSCVCVCIASRRPLIGPWEWTSCTDREPNARIYCCGGRPERGRGESARNGVAATAVANYGLFDCQPLPPSPVSGAYTKYIQYVRTFDLWGGGGNDRRSAESRSHSALYIL